MGIREKRAHRCLLLRLPVDTMPMDRPPAIHLMVMAAICQIKEELK